MQALILAGGLGTRLRPLVSDRPKALAPAGERPFLAHQIELLARRGLREIVLCVGYLHEQIERQFGDGRELGVSIRYSVEPQPLGTGGALKLAEPLVDDRFWLVNGDTYLDVDFRQVQLAHAERQSLGARAYGTIVLSRVDDGRRYGAVELDRDDRIVAFREKHESAAGAALVSAGMYLLEPDVFTLLPPAQPASLERDVFARLTAGPRPLLGYRADGFFVDMGTPEGYHTLVQHLESTPPCSFAPKPH